MARGETYSVEVECSNCDYVGTVKVPKGKPCTSNVKCEKCGCKTARKVSKPNRDILPFKPPRPTYPFPIHPWKVNPDRWLQDDTIPYKCGPSDRPPPTVTFSDVHPENFVGCIGFEL